ncbi:hypothetical protein [Teredinibacter haidensis]|uniref:hypothetical protein n=1 Tax=Teredinibacter haidensis TaxID=2731755 RepID=UPI0011153B17|nr:hypothetical protein [Teredinibacter haidensis]
MKSMVFSLLAFFYSFSVYGDTCFSDEKAIKKLSKMYLDKISFSADFSEKEIDVILKLPSQINGAELSSVFIVKSVPNIDDKTEFLFPLEIQKEGGKVHVWYMLSESMSDHNFIQASYGDGCGWLIEYELNYEGEKLKPK